MTLQEILAQLRDGKHYRFKHPNLDGYFEKAPYPSQAKYTTRDGAYSAITYWNSRTLLRGSPTMLLDDFERNDWVLEEVNGH